MLRLLATQRVGRIGITVQALPVVLPVNFGVIVPAARPDLDAPAGS